ncbi:hypothetical protein LDENG_00137050, partial [Lucifuga dentata]
KELLGDPDLKDRDVLKDADLLLFTECVTQTRDRLLEHVQKEISINLKNILHNEMSETLQDDESFVRLYVDVIQRMDGVVKTAERISVTLSGRVQEVCFQELLQFVKEYVSVQSKIIEKEAKKAKPEIIHIFKVLNNCKQLKSYIQTGSKGSASEETVAALEIMEASALKILLKHVSDFTQSHLKKYFKSDGKQIFYLIETVKERLPKLPCHPDVQQRVMDEVYQIITHAYLKHLVQRNRKKLVKTWKDDIGKTVTGDALLLHDIMRDLAPGVRQRNLILLKVQDVLECGSIDVLKIIMANILQGCKNERHVVDLQLLSDLLRWSRDLSRKQVREVLDACSQDSQPRPAASSFFQHLVLISKALRIKHPKY